MATYRRRGKSWRVEICHKGRRFSKSFPTKAECEKWANIKVYELNHGEHHPATKKTLKQALQRYLDEEVPKKRGAKREALFVKKLMTYPLANHLLENLTTTDFALWRDTRLTEVKAGTVRREATVLKAMYKVAINEWLWVRSSPLTNLKLPKEPPPRDRRISDEEIAQLLQAFQFTELKRPKLTRDFVACAFLFALETAMRSGEILALTWGNVHLDKKYVHIPQSKNGNKRDVPLSSKAIEILNLLPKDNPTCFKLDAEQRDSNFREYRNRTDIIGLTFHDTRHEAMTRLAQKLHILDLARMTGVRDPKTLMIYYNATATEIAEKLD